MWTNDSKFTFVPCTEKEIPQLKKGWHVAPKDRFVELTFHAGKYDYFRFNFKEIRSKSLDDGEFIEFISNHVNLLQLIVYPIVYSTEWYLLHALEKGDCRGDYAKSAVHSLFIKYACDEQLLKCEGTDFNTQVVASFGGLMSRNGELTKNPVKFFFPDWWTWHENLKQGNNAALHS